MVSPGLKSGLLMGFGAFFVALGAIMAVFWPIIFFNQLKSMMTLANGSVSYDVWKETPLPMYLEFFMFNITNTKEILAGNGRIKPKLQQCGPYVFKETHLKTNVTWYENSTVSFYNKRDWFFEPELSNGSLSDKITSFNPVIASASHMVRNRGPVTRLVLNEALNLFHEHSFLTANVSDLLFEGVEDRLLEIVDSLNISISLPFDKFGWFYKRNGTETYDGHYLINTGKDDFSQLGNVERWNGVNRTHFYRDECGDVKGSTGELWAPEMGQKEVNVFVPDFCTYMTLHRDSQITVEGITGTTFIGNKSVFDNGYRYPQKACFCAEERDKDCLFPGALNVSLCQYGAPAFVSFPHFYDSDPYYLTKVEGLLPNKEDHEFRMGLEMFTGIPVYVRAMLQVNLLVRHVPLITLNNVLPDDTLLPMFWFRQEIKLTPEYAKLAKFALNLRYGLMYGLYALTGIGALLLVGGIYVLIRRIVRPSEPPLIEEAEDE